MIKTSVGGFGRVTIKARHEWSRLSAPCLWGSTMAGTRFSSTCQTSPGGPTEPITLRRCVYRFVHRDRNQLSLDAVCISSKIYSEWMNPFLLLMSDLLFSSQIHANCRIRRVYFSDRLYSEDELPAEFKLYLPVQNQKAKVKHTHTLHTTT